MTTTTTDLTTAPSRNPLLAAFGMGTSAVLCAIGTFWDVTGNEPEGNHSVGDYLVVLPVIAVTAAIVFGLVVRTARDGNPGRRAAILGVVGFLSLAVFWAGLPMVVAAGAVACALTEKDKLGSFGIGSKAALALATITTAVAVVAAIAG